MLNHVEPGQDVGVAVSLRRRVLAVLAVLGLTQVVSWGVLYYAFPVLDRPGVGRLGPPRHMGRLVRSPVPELGNGPGLHPKDGIAAQASWSLVKAG